MPTVKRLDLEAGRVSRDLPSLLLLSYLILVDDNYTLAGHLATMGQLHKIRYLLEAKEGVRLDRDLVFGHEVKHPLCFVARGDQGAVNPDVAEY